MNKELENTEELIYAASEKEKKKRIVLIAVAAGVIAVVVGLFVGLNVHKNQQVKEQLKIAQAALKEGKYEQAIKGFSKAIEIDDNNSKAYEGRADVYMSLKDPEKAVPDYHKAIENNKKDEALYRKGIDASLQYEDVEEASKFLEEMKKNITEEKAEEIWIDEFGKVARLALDKKLKDLRYETVEYEDSAEMALEESVYFDVDGDGIDELVTVRRAGSGSGRIARIFAYRDNKVKKVLEFDEYGLDWIEVYDETKAIVAYTHGHGGEGYSYYKLEDDQYEIVASRGRQAIAGGGEKNGPWSYNGGEEDEYGTHKEIAEEEFNDLTKDILKGKKRKTESKDWKNEQNVVSADDLTKYVELEKNLTLTAESKGYSTIYAKNSSGKAVWSYKSKEYQMAQIDGVCFGIKNKYVYINDDGTLVKLEKTTGRVLKKSEDELGGMYRIRGDDEGNVYVIAFANKVAKYDKELDIKWEKNIDIGDVMFELSDVDIREEEIYVEYVSEDGDDSISLDPETGEEL